MCTFKLCLVCTPELLKQIWLYYLRMSENLFVPMNCSSIITLFKHCSAGSPKACDQKWKWFYEATWFTLDSSCLSRPRLPKWTAMVPDDKWYSHSWLSCIGRNTSASCWYFSHLHSLSCVMYHTSLCLNKYTCNGRMWQMYQTICGPHINMIKNCDPAVITPKSDYRPCQQQYPLKVEAIEGIRPVFDSLLKTGVIVPCDNSPVCTPFFLWKRSEDLDNPQNGGLYRISRQ